MSFLADQQGKGQAGVTRERQGKTGENRGNFSSFFGGLTLQLGFFNGLLYEIQSLLLVSNLIERFWRNALSFLNTHPVPFVAYIRRTVVGFGVLVIIPFEPGMITIEARPPAPLR